MTKEQLVSEISKIDSLVPGQEKTIGMVALSKEFYQKALDVVYQQSIGQIEELLNAALRFIFYDKDYSIKIELDEKYGKSLEFMIVDNKESPPMELSLTDGTGNGVRTVVSFVVHVFYLTNKGAYPVLFLDEALSAISEAYVDRFFQFVRGLVDQKGFTLVCVTHDNRIIEQAKRVYRIVDGKVELVKQ